MSLSAIMQKQDHPKCSLQQSIFNHIHLIITSAFGELKSDANFGCWIWENEFDNVTANNKIREQIKQSLLQALQNYEPRVKALRVEVFIRQEDVQAQATGRQVKKMLDISVTGKLAATMESFNYQDRFFTGPLSY